MPDNHRFSNLKFKPRISCLRLCRKRHPFNKPVVDTPEVAAARAHHLAIVQDVRARGASGVVSVTPTPLAAVASWSTPSSQYAQQRVWTVSSTPAPVQDTVEVAAAKAKHFAAVQEANARAAVASQQSYQHSGVQAYQQQRHHQQYSVSVTPSPVQETPEVAAAKAQHLAAVAQAAARVSSSNSLSSGYAVPAAVPAIGVSRFHYPNVPADLAPRFPAPAPTPIAAWPAANVAVRYNTIASVEDGTGRYVPDDEGQYDPRLDAEGQYDPRLDAEGQYVPSLNDEGQWVPSANEGQYIAGREDQSDEDNMPYSYSYSDGLSSKTETKTADGLTRGRYSYVDANGVLQAVDYEADNYNGFRASGTNLPQAPSAAPVAPAGRIYHPPGPAYPVPAQVFQAPIAAYGVPSQPIHPRPIAAAYAAPAAAVAVPDVPADTPEVAAAKAAHFAAHREAGARLASAYSG
ncbi:uncharacterized protein LOC117643278 [Thrips palmi]|uniref:Uncharacterized protein LOC117643278 n=1 Tax=Thrips palmi TaxID=161013 RepID=A0A6P8YLJ2_THRPL|nr:uncharacterized protein LOC117643278 [Thrips palmi]